MSSLFYLHTITGKEQSPNLLSISPSSLEIGFVVVRLPSALMLKNDEQSPGTVKQ